MAFTVAEAFNVDPWRVLNEWPADFFDDARQWLNARRRDDRRRGRTGG